MSCSRYRIFDIGLTSDVPLDLADDVPAASWQLRLRMESAREPDDTYEWYRYWTGGEDDSSPRMAAARTSDGYLVRFTDLADVMISRDGRQIQCRPVPDVSRESLFRVLLNQVIPLALSRTDRWIVHASAVLLPSGQAVAFVAPSGSGKSTLAAYLARNGCQLLADDALLLIPSIDRLECIAGSPHSRLWQDSRSFVLEHDDSDLATINDPAQINTSTEIDAPAETDAMSELRDPRQTNASAKINDPARADAPCESNASAEFFADAGKRRVNDASIRQAEAGQRHLVDRLYELTPDDSLSEPRFEPIAGREAFLALVRHTIELDTTDRSRLRNSFQNFADATQRQICHRLRFPHDWSSLPLITHLLNESASFLAK